VGFLFVVLALLALVLTAPFSEIKFKYTNKKASSVSSVSINSSISGAPSNMQVVEATKKVDQKALPINTNSLSNIFPKVQFPDLVTPIKSSFGNFFDELGKQGNGPETKSNLLKADGTASDLPNLNPTNLSLNPYPDNINAVNEKTVGKVSWQDNPPFVVKSDKFLPGTVLNVEVNGKVTELKVDASGLLPAETVLIVNKDFFKLLGGNPDTSREIDTIVKIK
jgi:hypothetical protein